MLRDPYRSVQRDVNTWSRSRRNEVVRDGLPRPPEPALVAVLEAEQDPPRLRAIRAEHERRLADPALAFEWLVWSGASSGAQRSRHPS